MEVLQFLTETYGFGIDRDIKIESIRHQTKRPRSSSTAAAKPPKVAAAAAKVGRHVVWNPGEQYTLLRPGKPIRNEAEAESMFVADSIDESYFYVFKNTDAKVERNQVIPVYEAAYFCNDGGYYIRVQKRYLKRAYAKKQRNDRTKMWDVLDDGTPYWVDRHAFCKQGQRESKKRHQQSRKSCV